MFNENNIRGWIIRDYFMKYETDKKRVEILKHVGFPDKLVSLHFYNE